jgi:hypothetical protein
VSVEGRCVRVGQNRQPPGAAPPRLSDRMRKQRTADAAANLARFDGKRPSKQEKVIEMLRRPEGATVDEVVRATGWQRHTVRASSSSVNSKKFLI